MLPWEQIVEQSSLSRHLNLSRCCTRRYKRVDASAELSSICRFHPNSSIIATSLVVNSVTKGSKDFYLLSTRERFSECYCLTSEQPWTSDSDVGFSSFQTDCYYKEKKSVLVKVSFRCLLAIYGGCNIF